MAKADIELLFGVKGGGKPSGESGKKIQNQINNIVGNMKPCLVEIELNKNNVKDFQRELSNLTAFAQSEAAKIQNAYKNIQLPSGKQNNNNNSGGGSKKNKNYLIAQQSYEMWDGIAKLQEKELKLKKMLDEWTTAKSGQSQLAMKRAEDELTNVRAYITALEQGQMTAEDLEEHIKNIGTTIRQVTAEVKLFGEDIKDINKNVDFTAGSEAHKKALLETSKLLIKTKKDYESWTAARNGATAADYSGLHNQITELERLHQELIDGSITYQEYKNQVDGIKSSITKFSDNIRIAEKDTLSLGDKVKALAGKFARWFSVSQIIMGAVRSIKEMAKNVVEIDKAMTELRKVTNETEATYDKFLANSTTRAKALGATLTDVVSATADFVKLGMTISEATAVADAAIVYKNVGDGLESIDQAAESIISTMQAFGDGAGTAIEIVDRYNAVGNNFAITSTGVGDALQRSAAAMNAAGNTLDETIALITAANTIVQNPESVGTTLKTVSMYLRAAKTEAEAAGEEVDGMAGSVSELRDELLELTGNKIDIQISDEEFKSTYQILKELSQVWDELTDISQANILEMIGGKRNANVVSSLLENFETAENALKVSAGSAGSALAENEKYLESIQGKIDQFQASWQTMSSVVVNSNFIKVMVDVGRTFIDVLTWIIDTFGEFALAVSAVPLTVFISKTKVVTEIFDVLASTAQTTAGGVK